jgi:hypothetical protein
MSRKSYDDEYDYDEDDYEKGYNGPRKFKRAEREIEKKKRWDRESFYDRDHDYDERR